MGNRAEVKLRLNSKGNRFRRTSRKRPDRSLRSPYGGNAPFISAADDIEARLDPFAKPSRNGRYLRIPAGRVDATGYISLSSVIGRSRTRLPVALNTALATAAPTPVMPISPTPRAPTGA